MPLCKHVSTWLAAILLTASAAAQPADRFVSLGVDDGLAQSSVAALAEDEAGFLWIGTEGGLQRYDGTMLLTFGYMPADTASLPSSNVQTLAATADSALWVGTYGGLARLNPNTGRFQRYLADADEPGALPHPRVLALHPTRDGRLWVGTEGGGAGYLDLGAPERGFRWFQADPETPGALPHSWVRAFAEAPDGALYLATDGGGLVRFDPQTDTFEAFTHDPSDPASLPGDEVWSLAVDKLGNALWIATRNGLARMALTKPGRFRRYRHDPSDPRTLPTDLLHAVLVDAQGHIWVGTDAGLSLLLDARRGHVRTYAHRPGDGALAGNRVRVLTEGSSGTLWAGTWSNGISRLAQPRFARYAPDVEGVRHLPASELFGMAEAPEGTLWIAANQDGLVQVDPAGRRPARLLRAGTDSGLPSAPARAVLLDADGTMWVAAHRLYRRRAGAARFAEVPFESVAAGRQPPSVNDLLRTRDGVLHVATNGGGVCRHVPASDVLRCPPSGGPARVENRPYRLFEDAAGQLWVSLWGGGVRVYAARHALGDTPLRRFVHDEAGVGGLSGNEVMSFYEDADGHMWMGTYGSGLSRLDPKSGEVTIYSTATGLPDNTIYATLPDDDGGLWLSTNRGLARLDPTSGEVLTFSLADGLQGLEYNGRSALRLRDGTLAFGGMGGLNLFHPSSVRATAFSPPVHLTALYVNGDARLPAAALPYRDPAPLRLDYRENFLAFEFAALDYGNPDALHYAYRLDGLDDGWVNAGDRRFAAYPKLAPGSYTFRVRGTNRDGAWSPHEASFALTVVPPFWMTGWFRALLFLGALLTAGGATGTVLRRRYHRRLARAEVERAEVARRREVERRLHAERERISRDLHDHVGAQLSTILSGLELVHLSADRGDAERARQYLDGLEGDARQTMTQLRETIWALHHEAVTPEGFCEQVRRFARQQTRYRDACPEVVVEAEGEAELSPLHALNLFRIAQEAVQNALKYAEATTIHVRLLAQSDRIVLRVQDDGCFRAPGGDGSASAEDPSGFGLEGIRLRAEELGGTFRLYTDGGTAIEVVAPLR